MAKPLRLESAGALYFVTAQGHETAQGNGSDLIYRADADREQYLDVLAQVCERFNWFCHAYCLMGNHYHLLIETPDANLSKGMRQLNGVYTRHFSRTHQRTHRVFPKGFKAVAVHKESGLLDAARDIVLSPVRAGVARTAADWPWSSYRATAGLIEAPCWLTTDSLLSAFGERRVTAAEGYREFVRRGTGANPEGHWQDVSSVVARVPANGAERAPAADRISRRDSARTDDTVRA